MRAQKKIYVFLSQNDLEGQSAKIILERLETTGLPIDFETCDVETALRQPVNPLHKDVFKQIAEMDNSNNIGYHTVLFKLNDQWLKEKCQSLSRTFHQFDHHIYTDSEGKVDGRRMAKSALEQFIDFLRVCVPGSDDLTDEAINKYLNKDTPVANIENVDWRLIAANDRGFRPALAYTASRWGSEELKDQISIYRQAEIKIIKNQNGKEVKTEEPITFKDCAGKIANNIRKLTADVSTDDDYYSRLISSSQKSKATEKQILNKLGEIKPWGRKASSELSIVYLDKAYEKIALDAFYKHEVEGEIDAIGKNNYDKSINDKLTQKCLMKYRNVIFLFGNTENFSDDTKIASISLNLGPDYLDFIKELMEHAQKTYADKNELKIYAGGSDAIYFGAERASKDAATIESDSRALERLADHIINNLLGANRPLAAWRTTFLCPVKISEDKLKDHTPDEEARDQEKHYFLKYLHSKLFPNQKEMPDPQSLQSYIYNTAGKKVEVKTYDKHQDIVDTCGLEIESARIHTYFKDVALLEWEFSGKRPVQGEQQAYWRFLLTNREKTARTVGDLLFFNAEARFLEAPFESEDSSSWADVTIFEETISEGTVSRIDKVKLKFGQKSEQNGKFFENFCLEIFGINISLDDKIFDERALLLSSACATGDKPEMNCAQRDLQITLARMADVEPPREYFPYDEEFSKDDLKRALYDRFYSFGSIYTAKSHSFAFLAFGNEKDFAYKEVHAKHMKTSYKRLFILMQFYRAILHYFESRLSNSDQGGIGELRKEYLDFQQKFWFKEVSSQEQGRELNQLLWKQANFEDMFQAINKILQRVDDLYMLKEKAKAKKKEEERAKARKTKDDEEKIMAKRKNDAKAAMQYFLLPFAVFVSIITTATNSEPNIVSIIYGNLKKLFPFNSSLNDLGIWFANLLILALVLGVINLIYSWFELKPIRKKQKNESLDCQESEGIDKCKGETFWQKFRRLFKENKFWSILVIIILSTILLSSFFQPETGVNQSGSSDQAPAQKTEKTAVEEEKDKSTSDEKTDQAPEEIAPSIKETDTPEDDKAKDGDGDKKSIEQEASGKKGADPVK